MSLEKGTREWQMFGDFFQLCKKYWDAKDTDEYWENLIKDNNDFYNKYKDIPLSKNIAIAFSVTQEEIMKKNRC